MEKQSESFGAEVGETWLKFTAKSILSLTTKQNGVKDLALKYSVQLYIVEIYLFGNQASQKYKPVCEFI